MIKIVPNFFQIAYETPLTKSALISFESSAFITFTSPNTGNGLGLFLEIDSNVLEFPYVETDAYAVAFNRKIQELGENLREEHLIEIELQLNQMVLDNNPEFNSKIHQLLTLFTGVVSNTTQLFLHHPIHSQYKETK
jgi:hypothetical protein